VPCSSSRATRKKDFVPTDYRRGCLDGSSEDSTKHFPGASKRIRPTLSGALGPTSCPSFYLFYAGLLALTGVSVFKVVAGRLSADAGSRLRRRGMRNYLMLLRSRRTPGGCRQDFENRTRNPPAFSTPSNSRDSISSAANQPNTGRGGFFHSKNFSERKNARPESAGDSGENKCACAAPRFPKLWVIAFSAAAGVRHWLMPGGYKLFIQGSRQRRSRRTGKHKLSPMMVKANQTPGFGEQF